MPETTTLSVAIASAMARQEWGVAKQLCEQQLFEEGKTAKSLYDYAVCLRKTMDGFKAIKVLNSAIEANPDYTLAYLELGQTYFALHMPKKAMQCYDTLSARKLTHPDIPHHLANIYAALGEKEKAEQCFRQAMELTPNNISLLYNFTLSRKNALADAHIVALKQAMEKGKTTLSHDAMLAAYALGKVYEQQKQWGEAFDCYQWANQWQSLLFPYDKQQFIGWLKHIRTYMTPERIKSWQGASNAGSEAIFIVGMPRSGTSLLEQILASHSDVTGAGELAIMHELAGRQMPQLTHFPYPDALSRLTAEQMQLMGDVYTDLLKQYGDTRYITDKLPSNFILIGLVKCILPQAKIIHSMRNPADTCWSLWRQYFPDSHYYKCDFANLAEVYSEYHALMKHWNRLFPNDILNIRYETLVSQPEEIIADILDYCELPWEDGCLHFHQTGRLVHTASKEQVRKPLYKTAMQSWKPVEAQLKPLLDALAKQGLHSEIN